MGARYILIIVFILFFSCKKEVPQKSAYETAFDKTFKIIQDKSVKKNELDWNKIKETVKDSIKQFDSNMAMYNAIGYTVELINDGHSVFYDPFTPNNLTTDTLSLPDITSKILTKDIAYIKLSGFFAKRSLAKQYALNIRKLLLELDHNENLSGWIIDLRKHTGGNLTPECLGLYPLFEDPLIGISINNRNSYREISCENNYFYFGKTRMDSLIYDSKLENKNKKIAVLVSSKTFSAGEFLALTFKFQNNSKLFGEKTGGKTSHLLLFEFVSNAKLLLATEKYCDRNKKVIGGGILPDVECKDEDCVKKAIEWINNSSADVSL